jgi:hypothetical protein
MSLGSEKEVTENNFPGVVQSSHLAEGLRRTIRYEFVGRHKGEVFYTE